MWNNVVLLWMKNTWMRNKLSHTVSEAQQGRSTTGTVITSQLTQDNLLLFHAFDNSSLALFPGHLWKWSTQPRWLAKQTSRRKLLMVLLMVPLPSFCKPSCGFEKTEDFVIRHAYCFRACLSTKGINRDHLSRYIISKLPYGVATCSTEAASVRSKESMNECLIPIRDVLAEPQDPVSRNK